MSHDTGLVVLIFLIVVRDSIQFYIKQKREMLEIIKLQHQIKKYPKDRKSMKKVSPKRGYKKGKRRK